jgi:hypothetical protein
MIIDYIRDWLKENPPKGFSAADFDELSRRIDEIKSIEEMGQFFEGLKSAYEVHSGDNGHDSSMGGMMEEMF